MAEMKLLDVGGGQSFFLENFIDLKCECISTTDPSYRRHDQWFEGIRIESELIHKMSYEDDYFDRVFCQGVMEHVHSEKRVDGMKEMARVLKPGGLLFLTYDHYFPSENLNKYASYVNSLYFRIDDQNKKNIDGKSLIDACDSLELWQPGISDLIYGEDGFQETQITEDSNYRDVAIPLIEANLYLTNVGMVLYKRFQWADLLSRKLVLNPVHSRHRISRFPMIQLFDGKQKVEEITETLLLEEQRRSNAGRFTSEKDIEDVIQELIKDNVLQFQVK